MSVHDRRKASKSPNRVRSPSRRRMKKQVRIKETKHINKSLFFLTQVISMLSKSSSSKHIPYRNSTLTKILKSSLGGNSKTTVILCLSPCLSQIEQTLSTLRFGISAKRVQNRVVRNEYLHFDGDNYEKVLRDYQEKLRFLEIQKTKEKKLREEMGVELKSIKKEKMELVEKLLHLGKREAKPSNLGPTAPQYTPKGPNSDIKTDQKYKNVLVSGVGLIRKLESNKKPQHLFFTKKKQDMPSTEEYIKKRTVLLNKTIEELQCSLNKKTSEILDMRIRLNQTQKKAQVMESELKMSTNEKDKILSFVSTILGKRKSQIRYLDDNLLRSLAGRLKAARNHFESESKRRSWVRRTANELKSQFNGIDLTAVESLQLGKRSLGDNRVFDSLDNLVDFKSKKKIKALLVQSEDELSQGCVDGREMEIEEEVNDDIDLLNPDMKFNLEGFTSEEKSTRSGRGSQGHSLSYNRASYSASSQESIPSIQIISPERQGSEYSMSGKGVEQSSRNVFIKKFSVTKKLDFDIFNSQNKENCHKQRRFESPSFKNPKSESFKPVIIQNPTQKSGLNFSFNRGFDVIKGESINIRSCFDEALKEKKLKSNEKEITDVKRKIIDLLSPSLPCKTKPGPEHGQQGQDLISEKSQFLIKK